jgi:hypothetical protein
VNHDAALLQGVWNKLAEILPTGAMDHKNRGEMQNAKCKMQNGK